MPGSLATGSLMDSVLRRGWRRETGLGEHPGSTWSFVGDGESGAGAGDEPGQYGAYQPKEKNPTLTYPKKSKKASEGAIHELSVSQVIMTDPTRRFPSATSPSIHGWGR